MKVISWPGGIDLFDRAIMRRLWRYHLPWRASTRRLLRRMGL